MYDHLIKLLLIGDSSVGKSSILLRYAESEFNPEQLSTIGIDFRIRTIVAADGKRLKLQIWDTAGQERFRSITQAYYRGAMGLMIVYDVTKEKTFQAVKEWVANVNQHADKSVICFLIGNKSDLESERKVSKEEGQRLADELHFQFMETSAKENINIEQSFTKLTEAVMKSMATANPTAAAATTIALDSKSPGAVAGAGGPGGCQC